MKGFHLWAVVGAAMTAALFAFSAATIPAVAADKSLSEQREITRALQKASTDPALVRAVLDRNGGGVRNIICRLYPHLPFCKEDGDVIVKDGVNAFSFNLCFGKYGCLWKITIKLNITAEEI